MSYGTILGQTPAVEPFDPKASNVQFDNSKGQGIVTSTNVQGAIEQIVSKDKSQDSSISSLNSSVSSLIRKLGDYENSIWSTSNFFNENIPSDTFVTKSINFNRYDSTTGTPDLFFLFLSSSKGNNFSSEAGCAIILGKEIEKLLSSGRYSDGGICSSSVLVYGEKTYNPFSILERCKIGKITSNEYQLPISGSIHSNGINCQRGLRLFTSNTDLFGIGNFDIRGDTFYFDLYTKDASYCTLNVSFLGFNKITN